MTELRFTQKAIADLRLIWNYTCEVWSEDQADKYYRVLVDVCRKVAARPALGKEYDEVAIGLYGMKAGRHIVFYRVADEKYLEVVRILHERMDLRSRLDG